MPEGAGVVGADGLATGGNDERETEAVGAAGAAGVDAGLTEPVMTSS